MPRYLDLNRLNALSEDDLGKYIENELDSVSTKTKLDTLEREFLESVKRLFSSTEYLLVLDGQLKNIKGEREIVLKLSTLHLILHVLEKKVMESADIPLAAEFAGTLVGREFAKTIIGNMIGDGNFPEYNGFLQVWCRLDTRAAWGHFRNPVFNETKETVTLAIDNPINHESDGILVPQSVTSFLQGYIHGVVDEGFRIIQFLFDRNLRYKNPFSPFVVKSVSIEKRDNVGYVNVKLQEPWLVSATDEITAFRYGFTHDSTSLRRSIEFALKELFEIQPTDTYAAFGLLKNLKQDKRAKKIDFSAVDQLWIKLNKLVHHPIGSTDYEVDLLAHETEYFLSEVLYYRLSKSIIKDISRRRFTEPSQSEVIKFETELNKNISMEAEEATTPDAMHEEVKRLKARLELLDILIPLYQTRVAQPNLAQSSFAELDEKLTSNTNLRLTTEVRLHTIQQSLDEQ